MRSEVPVLAAVKNQGADGSDGQGGYSGEQAQSLTSETLLEVKDLCCVAIFTVKMCLYYFQLWGKR